MDVPGLIFNQLKNLKVLVIGDTIIDEYVYSLPKARAIKDPILSTEYQSREFFAGGALAVANHLSDFVKKVRVITLLGDKETEYPNKEIKKMIKPNVTIKSFIKPDSYTTLKKRYVSPYRHEKLFKVEYINDKPIRPELSRMIDDYLERIIPHYDLVIVSDFGHGFINQALRETIIRKAKWLSVNAQTNSSNNGYNPFTNYISFASRILKKPGFMTMTEEELRLGTGSRWEDLESLIIITGKRTFLKEFIVTLGKRGSIIYNEGKLIRQEALANNPVDTMGAGDSLFAITSLLAYKNINPSIIIRIGSIAGAIASMSVGNKESINKKKITEYWRKTK